MILKEFEFLLLSIGFLREFYPATCILSSLSPSWVHVKRTGPGTPAKDAFIFPLPCRAFVSLTWLGLTVLTLCITKYQLHSWTAAILTLLRDPASVAGPSPASTASEQVRSHKLWWQRLHQLFAFGLESHGAFNPLSCGAFVGLSLTNAYLFFLKAHRVLEAKTEPSFAFPAPTGMTSGILQLQDEWGHWMV